MSLVGFKAQNHPQQTAKPDIDDRATEPHMFARLHERFDFSIDVAAAAHNTKLPRYYDTSRDGLQQQWTGESVWCNPPYSAIRPWIEKAWMAMLEEDARRVVMLLPANRTEQRWWQDLVEPYRGRLTAPNVRLDVEFLPGRIRFLKPGQRHIGPNERPPFGCCLLIWEVTA